MSRPVDLCGQFNVIRLEFFHESMFNVKEDIKGLVIRYRATKKFPHVDGMPPDGSYGLVLFPMQIKWTVLQSRVKYTSSASLLITRPIPDRTMPYNVLTM
eukprot:gene14292-10214_t